VVFGGGSLLTDTESSFACFLWGWHARIAQFFGKPILLAFQGIGPFRTKRGEQWAQRVVACSSFVSVRDIASKRRIERWSLNRKVVQSFDPVFSLLSAYKMPNSTKNVLAIFPRNSYDTNLVLRLRQVLQSRAPEEILFVLMQPSSERPIVARIQKETSVQGSVLEVTSLAQLQEALGSVSRVISQRYHGAIAALAAGKEVMIIPQIRGDKLDELQGMLQRGVQSEDLLNQVEIGESVLRKTLNAIASAKEGA
jgi:polysaccharide pyruvyl transferase WcaK-like protein